MLIAPFRQATHRIDFLPESWNTEAAGESPDAPRP
jgi:hypothetical protein